MSDNSTVSVKKAYVYFANLDGVRAIAALMVVVSHIEYHKLHFNLQQLPISLQNFGKIGVSIFFALSGFLITYLLLVEKDTFKKVNLKDFYIRRILRIWPLYFLIIVVGFFIYPAQGSSTALWLSVFFLPNLAFCLKMLPSIFDPIWSIGTEEQFYIFHPHIFKIKKPENVLITLVLLTVGFIAITLFVHTVLPKNNFTNALGLFLYYARFDNMMVGAIIAVVYYNTKNKAFNFKFQDAFNWIFTKTAQIILLLSLVVFICLYLQHEIPQGDMVIALLAGLIIVNLCEPATSIYSLHNKQLKYIGKISYGIYLLHKYPLYLMFYIVNKYFAHTNFIVQNVIIYITTISLVVALASLSYYGYERYFLRLKHRFQKVSQ